MASAASSDFRRSEERLGKSEVAGASFFWDFERSEFAIHVSTPRVKRCPDSTSHFPSGFIGTKSKFSSDSHSADFGLFRNELDDPKPSRQRLIRILEECADEVGEAIAVLRTLFALPLSLLAL